MPIVRIEVADDGPGVPATVADRLFVPFVTSKPPGSGTGLGLSVSFGIVMAHGGTIRHERTQGGGATFVVELPVPEEPVSGAADPAAPATGAAREGGPAGAPMAGAGARVLVLDDEPPIREFLGRTLERAGYEPVLAATAPEALEIIRTRPPDAILCDHRMAGMDGIAFLAAAVRLDPTLAGRFAFMSGDVLNPELRDAADARGVLLLAKPFDIAAVDGIVRTLLAGSPTAATTEGPAQLVGAPPAGG
jgi:two-component system NtrC family sensor kinase